MPVFALIMLLFMSLPSLAQRVVDAIHCFKTQEQARLTLKELNDRHDRAEERIRLFNKRLHRQLTYQRPQIEYVTDTSDQFQRSHCLLFSGKKLDEKEIRLIAGHQADEWSNQHKKIQGLQDPWGGKLVDLSGKPRALRACQKTEDHSQLSCEDIVITARQGEDNVIEYRFWLGAQSGEGLAVYKSPDNAVELSKVMTQLKKDKKNFQYSFAPKGEGAATFIEDARIGGR